MVLGPASLGPSKLSVKSIEGGQAQSGEAKVPIQRPCQFSLCRRLSAGGLDGGGWLGWAAALRLRELL